MTEIAPTLPPTSEEWAMIAANLREATGYEEATYATVAAGFFEVTGKLREMIELIDHMRETNTRVQNVCAAQQMVVRDLAAEVRLLDRIIRPLGDRL